MGIWHILACDIGGTNSRFGHFVLEGQKPANALLRLQTVRQCSTADIPTMDAAQAAALQCFGGADVLPEVQVWAAAGPLTAACSGIPEQKTGSSRGKGAAGASAGTYAGTLAGMSGEIFGKNSASSIEGASQGRAVQPVRAQLSNAALCVDISAIAQHGAGRVLLINDFAAQAWACVSEAGRKAVCLAGGGAGGEARTALGVVGAGTGLGMASLVPVAQDGAWCAVSSEGGHAPFAFVGEEEQEYARFLRQQCQLPVPTAEQILSGDGLERLHRYITGERLTAAEISAHYLQAAHGGDGAAKLPPTARFFARFYGRVCRQWILSACCTGGLYVCGGVATRNPVLVQCADFMDAIHAPDAPAWVRDVPLYLMDMPLSGLWGAARAGQEVCRQLYP